MPSAGARGTHVQGMGELRERAQTQTRAEREQEIRLAATVADGLATIEHYFRQPAGHLPDADLAASVRSVHEAFGALRIIDAKVEPPWVFDVVTGAIAQLHASLSRGAPRPVLERVWEELVKQVQVNLRTRQRS